MATFNHLTLALHPPLPDGIGSRGTGGTLKLEATQLRCALHALACLRIEDSWGGRLSLARRAPQLEPLGAIGPLSISHILMKIRAGCAY